MADNSFNNTVESLFKGMDSFITTKTVVGDAIHIGDTIILPLVDVRRSSTTACTRHGCLNAATSLTTIRRKSGKPSAPCAFRNKHGCRFPLHHRAPPCRLRPFRRRRENAPLARPRPGPDAPRPPRQTLQKRPGLHRRRMARPRFGTHADQP